LKFKSVPRTLTWDELVGMAKTCDKYDTANLVCDRVSGWIESHRAQIEHTDAVEWVSVAWAFGMEEEFKQALSFMFELYPQAELASTAKLPEGLNSESIYETKA
jgi:hypothetical protein